MQLHTVGLQRDSLWQELYGGGVLSTDASAIYYLWVWACNSVFLLQVSHHMATPDAQAEAKGEAVDDDSKSNTIPEVGLKYSLTTLDLTSHGTIWLPFNR